MQMLGFVRQKWLKALCGNGLMGEMKMLGILLGFVRLAAMTFSKVYLSNVLGSVSALSFS